MSIKALDWALSQPVKPSGKKFVLVVLANYADPDGLAYPSQPTIAAMTSQGVSTVRRWLADLEGAGAITRTARYRRDGTRTSDGYQLFVGRILEDEPRERKTTAQIEQVSDEETTAQIEQGTTAQIGRDYRSNRAGLPLKLSTDPIFDPSVNPRARSDHGEDGEKEKDQGNTTDFWGLDEGDSHEAQKAEGASTDFPGGAAAALEAFPKVREAAEQLHRELPAVFLAIYTLNAERYGLDIGALSEWIGEARGLVAKEGEGFFLHELGYVASRDSISSPWKYLKRLIDKPNPRAVSKYKADTSPRKTKDSQDQARVPDLALESKLRSIYS